VVRRALGATVDFHSGVYGDEPPNVEGRDVVIVDFSYKKKVLLDMADKATSITILDHHKTAAEDLAELVDIPLENSRCPLNIKFDMERSGARITWDHYFPGKEPPKLLLHVEDRDLWRFALPKTREIQANIFSYPYDFAIWDRLMASDPAVLAVEGEAIERKHFKDVAELVKVCRREMTIGGIVVPVASLPYTLTSDAGHLMATEHASKIGVCYWDTPSGRVFSLRSTDDGPDVSEIAKLYGGGGHKNASGFRVAYGHELAK
jgi:oligoribonuclease NrnB/cAMP/cGMP phosphodiesterase (DHH superfamily)